MKIHQFGVVTAIVLGCVIALSPVTQAAEKKQRKSRDAKAAAAGEAKAKKQDRFAQISERLNLTEEQKAKAKPIFEEEAKKIKALREKTGATPQERRDEMLKIRNEVNAKLKPILTDEQYKKLTGAQEKGRKREGGGKRSAQ